jgi:hypothetical protein
MSGDNQTVIDPSRPAQQPVPVPVPVTTAPRQPPDAVADSINGGTILWFSSSSPTQVCRTIDARANDRDPDGNIGAASYDITQRRYTVNGVTNYFQNNPGGTEVTITSAGSVRFCISRNAVQSGYRNFAIIYRLTDTQGLTDFTTVTFNVGWR